MKIDLGGGVIADVELPEPVLLSDGDTLQWAVRTSIGNATVTLRISSIARLAMRACRNASRRSDQGYMSAKRSR